MTLTNEPVADLVTDFTQEPPAAPSRDRERQPVADPKLSLDDPATPVAELTPQQREQRLMELKGVISAAKASPENLPSLYCEQALLLFAAQDYAAAVAAWDQSLALQPKQAQAWYHRGMALDRQGSHLLALASYDQVIKLEPGHHQAWGNRAIALRKLGRAQEAKEAARIAFELNPEDMVDSFFQQLALKQPKLGFIWKPLGGLVQQLRR